MSEQKIKTEEIPKIEDFPVEWQIIIRGTQSLTSKARDGADITIVKENDYFAFITKKTSLEVVYYKDTGMLEVVWKRYKFVNDEREPVFIKTYKKKIEKDDAKRLMFAWFEKILYHVDYKSNNTIIFQDFYYLYKAYEEQKEL